MASIEATSTRPKKEKSSKKRKSETLTEGNLEHVPDAQDEENPPEGSRIDKKPSKKRKIDTEEIEVDISAPEPPSKKALRALKKGKPLPPSKSGAESSPEPQPKKEKPKAEKRSEHGIWIGNLAFFTSKTDLRTFLVEKSDLTEEMITRVHMPGPDDKKPANKVPERKFGKTQHNIGYAYVDLSTKEAIDEAISLSEQLLGGRRVLIKNAKSFEGRPEKTKEQSRMEGKSPSKRVFIGNLPFEATEDSIKEFFQKCGAIESVKLATFEDSGKCKGYGWVVFEELEAAQNAVRGFIIVEEEESDASDSEEDSDPGSDKGSNEVKVATRSKPKRRKVWANMIDGQKVRAEFAEDAEVRYKKRYGKNGSKRSTTGVKEQGNESKVYVPKKVEYRESYAPRLTGGIVESKGKKLKF